MTYKVQLSSGLAILPDKMTESDITVLTTALRIRAGLPAVVAVISNAGVKATTEVLEFVKQRMTASPQKWLRPSLKALWAWHGSREVLEAAVAVWVKRGCIKETGNLVEWIGPDKAEDNEDVSG